MKNNQKEIKVLKTAWKNIINKCNNPSSKAYQYYGKRGIKVCDRWLKVENFINDMFPIYQEGLSIDRINNDGNYDPNNCRWVNKTIQSRNTRLIRKNNSSGYRGVYLYKRTGKWISQIRHFYTRVNLGTFNTAIEAAKAYDKYVIENNLEHTKNF